jgi:hypothetical protein
MAMWVESYTGQRLDLHWQMLAFLNAKYWRRTMATSKTRSTPKKSKPAPDKRAIMTPAEHIRERAYYLSLERKGLAADPIADWLRAERELTTGKK